MQLKAGEKKEVKVELSVKYATSYWDEIRDSWKLEEGAYEIQVVDGTGAQEAQKAEFKVDKSSWWRGL